MQRACDLLGAINKLLRSGVPCQQTTGGESGRARRSCTRIIEVRAGHLRRAAAAAAATYSRDASSRYLAGSVRPRALVCNIVAQRGSLCLVLNCSRGRIFMTLRGTCLFSRVIQALLLPDFLIVSRVSQIFFFRKARLQFFVCYCKYFVG